MFTKKRSDGTYIRNLQVFNKLLPYLMPTRTESTIFYDQSFNITKTLEFVRKKRANPEGVRITVFYIFLYA